MKPGNFKWWGYLVLFGLVQVVEFAAIFLIGYVFPVQASSPPEVTVCVEVAKTVAHTVFRCEDVGLDNVFYMNELGLPMIPWEK